MTNHFILPEEWDLWYAEHVKTCKQCSDESNGPAPLCDTAFNKMQEIVKELKIDKVVE
jgi:hypothetical protein